MNRRRVLVEESGFTLIELLGVALIVVILAVIALPIYAESHEKGLGATSIEELRRIELALEAYKLDPAHSLYPPSLQALVLTGHLKNPTDFRSPWYGENKAHYLYFVSADRTRFVIVDPGPNCGFAGNFPCGESVGGQREMTEYEDLRNAPGTRRSSH